VRDLGSRNGTFLNREPVADATLREGDVLHVGDHEFRVSRDIPAEGEAGDDAGTLVRTAPLSRNFVSGALKIRELIDKAAVTMFFQPIVTLPSARVAAYEALGRGRMPGLPENPVELFDLAGALGAEAQAELSRLFRRRAVELVRDRPEPPLLFLNTHPIELFEVAGTFGPEEQCRLSRLFRRRAVELAKRLPQPPLLFLNTHPVELAQPGLLESLGELRAFAPQVQMVLEIHESALAQPDFIRSLRESLDDMSVGLAFDDFGAGQARLFELAEAPPHYLKFDRRFVTGIDRAPVSRQRLVASLVAAARELLVSTIAEGVETAAEAATCQRAGFTHAQGNHFGRPAALEAPAAVPAR
jgi:EAL domain-containing protein (putative c-di-GMP-specific phosphodiesterase class I)